MSGGAVAASVPVEGAGSPEGAADSEGTGVLGRGACPVCACAALDPAEFRSGVPRGACGCAQTDAPTPWQAAIEASQIALETPLISGV